MEPHAARANARRRIVFVSCPLHLALEARRMHRSFALPVLQSCCKLLVRPTGQPRNLLPGRTLPAFWALKECGKGAWARFPSPCLLPGACGAQKRVSRTDSALRRRADVRAEYAF